MKKFFDVMCKFVKVMLCVAIVATLVFGSLYCYWTNKGFMATYGWALAAVWSVMFFVASSNMVRWHRNSMELCGSLGKLIDILDGSKAILIKAVPSGNADAEKGEPDADDNVTQDDKDRMEAAEDVVKCAQEAIHYLKQGNDEFSTATANVELKVVVKHQSAEK